MLNAIRALLYRNLLLYYKFFFLSLLLIGWAFVNIAIAGTPSSAFISTYVPFFSMQYQSVFVHGLVDDRHSRFRVVYKIMGLGNTDYLLSQTIAFTIILILANVMLFTTFGFYNLYHGYTIFDDYTRLLFVLSIVFSLQSVLFGNCLSYLFRNPKISRDVSFLINLSVLLLAVYASFAGRLGFLRYLNPYYNLTKIYVDTSFGMIDPSPRAYLETLFMLFQICLYGVLMVYLDNIHPSENDHQKSPLYFLDCILKRNGSASRELDEVLDADPELNQKSQMDDDALTVIGLKKSFGSFVVLKGISAKFEKGRVHSLLGHNGAGKSTFINMLTGIYKPTEGQIFYGKQNFRDLRKYAASLLNIGICPAFDVFFPQLTVYNHLRIIGMIKNIRNLEVRISEVMSLLKLTEYRNFAVSKLSGGNKRKLTLGISIISRPTLLFLDEPTSAVDPVARKEIWQILLQLKQNKNMITLLTTHHLEEAEFLSDKINVLGFGEILVSGTVEDIKRKFGVGYTLNIINEKRDPSSPAFREIKDKLVERFNLKHFDYDDSKMTVKVSINKIKRIGKIMNFLKEITPSGLTITIDSNTLEQAYFEIDRLNQDTNAVSNTDSVGSILDKLYARRSISSFGRIWLVSANKLHFIFSNVLEVLKLVMTYLCISVGVAFAYHKLRENHPINISIVEYTIAFIVVMEISLHSFSAYNIVYDRINDIKTMMYVNKVKPFEYYAGKYIADIVVQSVCYLIVLISFMNTLSQELKIENFGSMFYLLFFKLFMWRCAFVAFSYLLARVFDNLQNVLKYFSLAYGLAVIGLGIVIKLTKLEWLDYLNETNVFFDIYKNPNVGYVYTALVLGTQLVAFLMINVMREVYFLRFNYVNPGKSNSSATETLGGVSMGQGLQGYSESIALEETNTKLNKNLKLRAVNLRKQYGNKKVALNNVTFNVDHETYFGLVGQNGAGKSTTFNIILNRILKTKGELTVDNLKTKNSFPSAYFQETLFDANNVAACFQGNSLWNEMSVLNNLKFYASLNNINPTALTELVKFFEFDFYLKKRVSELSSGNQRKLCIIISLMINPNMVFYDEATTGVDLIIRMKLKTIFDYIKKQNNCVGIFTTHFLKDIELFCNKLGIVKNGNFLYIDTVDAIKRNLGGYLINFVKSETTDLVKISAHLEKYGRPTKGYKDELKNSESVILYDLKDVYGLVNYLLTLEQIGDVQQFTINQLSIEDIYLKLLDS